MPLRPVECSPGCPCCVSRPRPPSCRPPSSQLCPEPLDSERGGEHSRRSQGGDGPHVVPGGPLRDVLGPAARRAGEIGRASCRERVEISVVAVSLKKKNKR